MPTTHIVGGVRYGRYASHGGRFGPGRCHLAVWRRDVKAWALACKRDKYDDLAMPYGELVDKDVEVTCKWCLRIISRLTPGATNQPTQKESDMPGFWDDPELRKAAEGGDFVKFINLGDEVAGVVKTLKKQEYDGRTAIEVEFSDGRKCTFGQWLMLRELYTLQPEPGEELFTKWVAESKKGAKTTKVFAGHVTRLDGTVDEFDQRLSSE